MAHSSTHSSLHELVDWFADAQDWAQIDFKNESAAGRKIIGVYCGYMPMELIRAAGGIAVSLCGSDQSAIPAAEATLPRNFCPLVKSSYGLAITDTCPFFHFADALIGETTCDGKKKVFELLGELKPVHVMQLPFRTDDSMQPQWLAEIRSVARFAESVTGQAITPESLAAAIAESNAIRRGLRRIAATFTAENPALSWLDMLTVQSTQYFLVHRADYIAKLTELAEAIEALPAAGRRPRILITGTPMGEETGKVMRLVEEAGGRVVCHDACSGIKMYDRLVAEDGDPYEALARYTLGIPCACMSPNDGRLDLLRRSVDEYRVEGIIDNVWQCCHTFNVESVHVGRVAREELGVPFLKLETDYSDSDLGPLSTRIEAFLEQIG